MAIAIASPLCPGGTLDSLASSRSLIYGHDLKMSLNARRKPRFQKLHYFASYNTPNIKNLEHAETESTGHLNRSNGKTAIQRIAEKLRSLGYVDEVKEEPKLGPGSAGEIFIPHPKSLPTYRIGHTIDRSWSSPEHPIPEPGQGTAQPPDAKKKQGENSEEKKKREIVPTLAELTIPEKELKRLRTIGIRTDRKLKVGKAGISEGIVDSIHERWRNSEVVKIRCDDICRMNMKRTHDILERKTGGLVVWRAGSVIILYRGTNYEPPYVKAAKSLGVSFKPRGMPSEAGTGSINTAVDGLDKNMADDILDGDNPPGVVDGNNAVGSCIDSDIEMHKTDFVQAPGETEYEREINEILDGLGPRFTDWWGYEPLPVDADLLPAVVPGYRKPFRLLPYGMKPKLTNIEMTVLRRLARPLPPHFALGRNYRLQGLAAAMLKLWEKSEIVKIAVKRGVQNTNSAKMAEDLKRLTGGSLLSRDREFIVFYRGKDFLPPAVASALAKRKAMADSLQEKERKAMADSLQEKERKEQLKACLVIQAEGEDRSHVPGTVEQSPEAKDQWEKWVHSEKQRKIKAEASRAKWAAAARRLDSKLAAALAKKVEVENDLAEVENVLKSSEPPADRETITEEERFMLRKLGLRLKSFLLLGRRGVFDGVVENMHLHWKYRELVKIISKEKSVAQVQDTARMLEYESGGVLVAVERVPKGHAIIIYRGKNYRRPTELRPKGLLTKRAALKRSIELQRRESLSLHILRLERNIERLKSHLSKVEDNEQITEQSIEESYSAYSSEDEEEGNNLQLIEESAEEEANLEPYDRRSETKNQFQRFQSVKNAIESIKYESHTAEHPRKKKEILEPIFQAEPLSNRERLILRKQALKMRKTAQLHVGKSNVVSGLAKSIRSFLQKHAFVKVGVKGRAKGTSVSEIVSQLEEATGAVLVSQEPSKVILYRGWPEGQEKPLYDREKPLYDKQEEDVSPELIKAMRKECGLKVEVNNENTQNDVEEIDHTDDNFMHMDKDKEPQNLVKNFVDDLRENREMDGEYTVQSDFSADSMDNNEIDEEDASRFEPFLMGFQDNLMENGGMDNKGTAYHKPHDVKIVEGKEGTLADLSMEPSV